jgi:hypothetical protein
VSEIASAYVSLLPSGRGFGHRLDSEISGDVKKSGSRMGATFGKLFAAAAGGLAVGNFLKSAISEASDLNEAGTKTQAIFGEAGKALVDRFAKRGAKALGQTKLQVLDAASTFGTFGKAAGKTGPELAKFSTGLVGLSTDLASFFNASPAEAAEAIAAGLRGEAEPLRKYGVLLNDATLRQEALRQGLVKTTKDALTPQQKVLAAQAVIMKQTKDAQGDFARTSGGLANQQRILSASFTNLKGTIGKALLPTVTKFVGFLNDRVLPAVTTFIGEFKRGEGTAGTLKTALAGVGDVLGTVVGFLKDNKEAAAAFFAVLAGYKIITLVTGAWAALNAVMAANPVGLVVLAIAGLAAGLVYAYKKSETFRSIVDGAFKAVSTAAKFMWERVLKPVFKFVIDAWLTVAGQLVHGAALAFGWIPGIGPKLKGLDAQFAQFRDSVNAKLNGIKDREVKVTAKVYGLSAVDALIEAITKVDNKDVTVTAHGHKTGGIGSLLAPRMLADPLARDAGGWLDAAGRRAAQVVQAAFSATFRTDQGKFRAKLIGDEWTAALVKRTKAQKLQHKLDVLQGKASIRDLKKQLHETKKGHHVLRGLQRDIAKGQLKQAKAALAAVKSNKDAKQSAIDAAKAAFGEKQQKLIDAYTSRLDGIKSKAEQIASSFADLSSSIAAAFKPGDLFSGSAAQLFSGLTKWRNNLQTVKSAQATLLNAGLSGDFLTELFSSGNVQLIGQLAANPSQALEYQSLFESASGLAKEVGDAVAEQATSADVMAVVDELAKVRQELKGLPGPISKGVADAVNNAAAAAVQLSKKGRR